MALPDYLEDTAKDFALHQQHFTPIDKHIYWRSRRSRTKGFGRRDHRELNPFIAGMDPMQTQAMGI